MSAAIRCLIRFPAIAALVVLAPTASAVGQEVGAPAARDEIFGPAILTPEQARQSGSEIGVAAVRETIRLQKLAREEAIRRRKEAAEDARVTAAIEAQAKKLKPGKYVWRPERGMSGPVEMVASIEAQLLYVFRSGKLIAVSTISTGRAGNETPTGSFPILQKKRMHHSNLYDNAPMPNMQRMTWDGVALHAGHIPGHAASHGCVRLPIEFSRLLFGVTRIGSVVHVVADRPVAPGRALASVAAPGGGARAAYAR